MTRATLSSLAKDSAGPSWRPPRGRPALLIVTDLAYRAKGRRYCDEDIFLTARLRQAFDVALCHPLDVVALMDAFDAVVVRNSGPVVGYQAAFDHFRAHALERGARVFNSLTGKADMVGKQYLVDLTRLGYPVIPSVDRHQDVDCLPQASRYVVKPKLGADSMGLRVVSRKQLDTMALTGMLVQPRIDFDYEVSFYFIGRAFQYAFYAPRPQARWALERYDPTPEDLDFAVRFVDWNAIQHGVQRIDACRTQSGALLLVELEDLNPYLSLDLLDEQTRDSFIANLIAAINDLVRAP